MKKSRLNGFARGQTASFGADLKPRPLGYEFDGCYLLVAGVSCCSVTYLFLLLPGLSYCFVVLLVVIASEMLARQRPVHML
jgi:hypothetical protein